MNRDRRQSIFQKIDVRKFYRKGPRQVNQKSIFYCHSVAPFKREGGRGSKKQVWLILKSNLSWSCYFLRNRKIFAYDENMVRQSSGVLLSLIQNIGG